MNGRECSRPFFLFQCESFLRTGRLEPIYLSHIGGSMVAGDAAILRQQNRKGGCAGGLRHDESGHYSGMTTVICGEIGIRTVTP